MPMQCLKFVAGVFAVVSLMVGVVVNRSDCSSSYMSSIANESVSVAGVTLPFTLATTSSADYSQQDDFIQCKLGVATATALLVGVYQVNDND